MGVLDQFKSTVLTTYKVDTKPMRKGLKDLDKAQKKQAQSAIDAAEKQNDAMDSQIAMLGKVAIGVGAVVAAYKAATVGLEAYQKRSQLTAATSGVNLDRLKKATNGLVSETRLLEFASKAMNGTFKLSQTQMEVALKGALALRKEGNELGKTLDNIGKAVQEGTSEPLKELGLNFKTTNDSIVGVDDVLKELARTAREKGGDLALPGDRVAASQVKIKDATDQLKVSMGALADDLAPVLEALAAMVNYMTTLSDRIAGITKADRISSEKQAITHQLSKGFDPALQRRLDEILKEERLQESERKRDRLFGKLDRERNIPKVATKTRRVTSADATPSGLGLDIFGAAGGLASGIGGAIGGRVEQGRGIGEEDRQASIAFAERQSAAIRDSNAQAKELFDLTNAQNDNAMTAIFGTPAEMDERTASIMQLASAFDGLAGAFGAGVDALITGSESFASAFKNAIGESLRAMAVEMSINALKHTAYGLASLAFLDGRGATAHFAAAGQFAAGAVGAGVGARLMGAGGGGSSAGSPRTAGSSGVGASSGGSGSDDGGKTSVFIVGNDFAGMNARQREAMWRQTSRSAGVQIDGDVVLNG